ncbi:MAG: hypothetical protein WCJ58_02190 [bacterium]
MLSQKIIQLTHKIINRKTILWILTIIISFGFVASVVSLNTNAATPETAAKVYYNSSGGAIETILEGLPNPIIGHYQETEKINWTGSTKEQQLIKPGALHYLASYQASLYQAPPASGIVWAQDQVNKMKGIDNLTVYAATDPSQTSLYYPGQGYNLLRPVMVLWQWIRNIVYFIFIIIMIVIGLMVLFRTSLGGQTLVTITNSLPAMLWAILLVTISYPICGFAVDMIYIGSGFMQSIMITGPNAPGKEFLNSNFIDSIIVWGSPNGKYKDVNYLQPDDAEMSIWSIWATSNSGVCGDADCKEISIIPDALGNHPVFSWFLAPIKTMQLVSGTSGGNTLMVLFLAIATFQASVKILWALLKAWATLILAPIWSPVILMAAAIPGNSGKTLSSLIRTLATASLTFVAIYATFLFMVVVGQSTNFTGSYKSIGELSFMPPLLGYGYDQTGIGGTNLVKTLLIFVLFMFAPTIPDLVASIIKPPPLSEFLKQTGRNIQSGVSKPKEWYDSRRNNKK